MKGRLSSTAMLGLVVVLLLPLNAGCDNFLRGAADVLDDVADELDDFADYYGGRRHRDFGDAVEDLVDDIEDWFD